MSTLETVTIVLLVWLCLGLAIGAAFGTAFRRMNQDAENEEWGA